MEHRAEHSGSERISSEPLPAGYARSRTPFKPRTANCPACGQRVALALLNNHYLTCTGRTKLQAVARKKLKKKLKDVARKKLKGAARKVSAKKPVVKTKNRKLAPKKREVASKETKSTRAQKLSVRFNTPFAQLGALMLDANVKTSVPVVETKVIQLKRKR